MDKISSSALINNTSLCEPFRMNIIYVANFKAHKPWGFTYIDLLSFFLSFFFSFVLEKNERETCFERELRQNWLATKLDP